MYCKIFKFLSLNIRTYMYNVSKVLKPDGLFVALLKLPLERKWVN